MIATSFIPVRTSRDPALLQEWELVLLSQGLSPHVGESLDGFVLSVPEHESERALAALVAYEQERATLTRQSVPAAQPISLFAGIVVGELLLLFFLITQWKELDVAWFMRGSADAARILSGELWRAVTALTLHADLGHVLGNAAAAAIFLSMVCNLLGVGLGSALVLLAGAGGNWLNAWMHGSSHISVGASTAVFGAVGMLGVLGVLERRRQGLLRGRRWLPFAAALALLAMLGTAGLRVDLFAHLFGFAAGAILAVPFAMASGKSPAMVVQMVCGAAAVALIVYCWYLALA